MEEKTFKFKKGTEDWKTWSKIETFICDYFSKIRKDIFSIGKLRTDYKITVKITKGKELK